MNRISAKSNTSFDLMLTDTVDLIIDIPTRNDNLKDGFLIRRFAVEAGIPNLYFIRYCSSIDY